VRVLEVPVGEVSRAKGDIHPFGNPHIMLDPRNGLKILQLISNTVVQLDPKAAAAFRERTSTFSRRLSDKIRRWSERLAPYRDQEVVTYHRVWSYFFSWSGLRYAEVIENKPGIPPSPSHVSRVIETMRSRKIPVIFVAHYTPPKVARRVAALAGARAVVLPALVGADSTIRTYEDLFEVLVSKVVRALEG